MRSRDAMLMSMANRALADTEIQHIHSDRLSFLLTKSFYSLHTLSSHAPRISPRLSESDTNSNPPRAYFHRDLNKNSPCQRRRQITAKLRARLFSRLKSSLFLIQTSPSISVISWLLIGFFLPHSTLRVRLLFPFQRADSNFGPKEARSVLKH